MDKDVKTTTDESDLKEKKVGSRNYKVVLIVLILLISAGIIWKARYFMQYRKYQQQAEDLQKKATKNLEFNISK